MRTTLFRICITSLSLFVIIKNYAQTHDFRKGFIISLKNDTTYGFLDYATPFSNGQFIVFKKDSSSNIMRYFPEDIKAYAFLNSKYYIRKDIPFGRGRKLVFLEYMVNGILDLYYIQFANKEDVYFIEKDGDVYELKNDVKYIYKEDKKYEFKNQKYKGALKFLMKDALLSISNEIDNTSFDYKSLIKITKDYHEMVCDSVKCIVYYKKEKKLNDVKWRISYGIGIGYMQSQLNMDSHVIQNDASNSNLYNYDNLNEFNSVFASKASTFLPAIYLNLNRNERFSFQLELRYKNLIYPALQIQQVSIPLLVNYDFLYYSKTRPFISAGIGLDINVSTNIKDIYIEYTHFKNTENQSTIVLERDVLPVAAFNKLNPTISFGAGIKHNISKKNGLKFEIRYEIATFSNKYYSLYGRGQTINSNLKYSNLLFFASYYFQ